MVAIDDPVARCVCLFSRLRRAKTAERIEIPLGLETLAVETEHCITWESGFPHEFDTAFAQVLWPLDTRRCKQICALPGIQICTSCDNIPSVAGKPVPLIRCVLVSYLQHMHVNTHRKVKNAYFIFDSQNLWQTVWS